MEILVLSDTHKSTKPIRDLLEAVHKRVDAVIHLGDCHEDILSFRDIYKNLKFYYVKGNCDFSGQDVPYSGSVIISGKKIWFTHGHRYSVKFNSDRIIYAAMEQEASVCLFGHTHMPELFYHSGILFMNPGSMYLPRDGRMPSYGVLEITDGQITPRLVGIQADKIYKPFVI